MYCDMHESFFPHVNLVCAGGTQAGGDGGGGGGGGVNIFFFWWVGGCFHSNPTFAGLNG